MIIEERQNSERVITVAAVAVLGPGQGPRLPPSCCASPQFS